eukprot:scaffold22577_cov122-Cylindrotheca_fusiformis.AAC.42
MSLIRHFYPQHRHGSGANPSSSTTTSNKTRGTMQLLCPMLHKLVKVQLCRMMAGLQSQYKRGTSLGSRG